MAMTNLPTLFLDHASTGFGNAPDTVFLVYQPERPLAVNTAWQFIVSTSGLINEGHIVNIRTVSRQWIEFVISWPNRQSFTILLVQRHILISDPLVGHPARALLQWIMEAYTQYSWETGMQEHLSILTSTIYISVHLQALSTITGYPAMFTLVHTPVKLYVGQVVNILEYYGGGPPIGVAKITAFHAIEQSWVDVLAQLGPDADRRHGSPFIHIFLPITHIVLPPILAFLHRKFFRYLPEILAHCSLQKTDPLPTTNRNIRSRL